MTDEIDVSKVEKITVDIHWIAGFKPENGAGLVSEYAETLDASFQAYVIVQEEFNPVRMFNKIQDMRLGRVKHLVVMDPFNRTVKDLLSIRGLLQYTVGPGLGKFETLLQYSNVIAPVNLVYKEMDSESDNSFLPSDTIPW